MHVNTRYINSIRRTSSKSNNDIFSSSKNNQRKTALTADHGNCQLGSNTSPQSCLCSTDINKNTDFSRISNLTFVILTTQRQRQQDELHILSKVLDIHDQNCQNNLPYATTKRLSLSHTHTYTHTHTRLL